MLVNGINEQLASLDEGYAVYLPDGTEVMSIKVENKKVYFSAEKEPECPECQYKFDDVDEYICENCGWTDTNHLTCNECASDVDLCECDEQDTRVEIHTVTYIEDYVLENQYAYTDIKDAVAKERELNKKLFEESFNAKREEFEEDDDFMAYQHSMAWWDDDCRSKVHSETVVLESSKNTEEK